MVRYDISRESIKSPVRAGFGIRLTIEASLGANFAGVIHREVRDGTGPARVSHSAHWRQDNENLALAGFARKPQQFATAIENGKDEAAAA
jgi:hypothetical protein